MVLCQNLSVSEDEDMFFIVFQDALLVDMVFEDEPCCLDMPRSSTEGPQ